MKEQFILFIDDIKSNLRSFLISTLQLGTGLLILCYILQTTLDFQLVEKKITTAMKDTEIYMLRDNTSDKKFDRIINEKKYLPGLQELYGKIDEIFVNSTFMVIILIFALVGIIGNLLQFIAQYKREFAINMLCGATMWQIILRILMQVIVMFGIALLTVLAVYGIRKAFWLTVLCSAVFIVLVLIYPVHMIAKSTIQSMFKRSYE